MVISITQHAASLEIVFDYSYDTQNFFDPVNHPERRTALEHAAGYYTRIRDNLSAISPEVEINFYEAWVASSGNYNGPSQVYSPTFLHPGTGEEIYGVGITIPEKSIVIYAGGHDLMGSLLAQGHRGGAQPASYGYLYDQLAMRGQGDFEDIWGNTANDVAPWGGSIAFDTHNEEDDWEWYYGITGTPGAEQYDFVATAVHEIAHVLGWGVSDSHSNLSIDGYFHGTKTKALFGGNPVPLHESGHFADNLAETIGYDPLMDPTSEQGVALRLTPLDFASLQDIGWELALDGDANLDGTVDIGDLAVLASKFNTTDTTWHDGDFNNDHVVNIVDLSMLASKFNQSQIPPEAIYSTQPLQTSNLIPEPASSVILLFMMSFCVPKRHSLS